MSKDEQKDGQRVKIVNLLDSKDTGKLGQDVVAGLCAHPRYLPPKYFYDERGSQLFEQICELPEYYPTRTETAILQTYGSAIAQATGPCEIVELGSGSSTKTRILLDAYQKASYPLRYLPVDVSDTMLRETADKLLQEYSGLSIYAISSTYESALKALPKKQFPARMIAFIGSTIGNLLPEECDRFLSRISETLEVSDYFLLGVDLQKEISVLESAYNDSQGITAAFNLNMLRHLNQKFEGNFDLSKFLHIAHYNKQANQIEMYLESMAAQTVRLETLELTVAFENGDRILSEISRKFDLEEMTRILASHQLNVIETFSDPRQWFGLLLCQRCR
ncbi:L-histidine N(alpha)-methyltransferase [Synechococcus sp. PCC 7335]|uniref:L-histidine N(alpha)-methyltransferase n=1 Tax=Synechococcus sp. (strain ATCC 29403 / PCC 7335) TaxID=91464 RepID=UPI00056EABE4|nr:L-histidine N(alpha)-methyltransferase [Synechococcus sp. PCC 7335]